MWFEALTQRRHEPLTSGAFSPNAARNNSGVVPSRAACSSWSMCGW